MNGEALYTVFKEFSFDAAHWLPNVPKNHQCGRMHGHTYHVRVSVQGVIDPKLGWVVDYADISKIWKDRVHSVLDHTCLNDTIVNSTSELLAKWIWTELSKELAGLHQVEVRETDTAGCVYGGGV